MGMKSKKRRQPALRPGGVDRIDEGLLNTAEMLETLRREDGIVISWRVEL